MPAPDASAGASIIWRGFTREALDSAYNNSAAVTASPQYLADWTVRSAVTRARPGALLDLRYGPHERNRIDLFPSGAANAPLFAFIHGGYWQRNSKEIFACMAEGPLAAGIDVALIGYTLAPKAKLGEIVAEIAAAVRFIRREGPSHGVARGLLVTSGWSAGGHLTATTLTMAEVDAGLAISGVFDIEPCRLNYLNEKLRLAPDDVERLSPIRHVSAGQKPVTVVYGTGELPELQRQSIDYATAVQRAGARARLRPLVGHDHFSILEELARPDGAIVRALGETLATLAADTKR